MKVFNFFPCFIVILLMVQLALAGDRIIEDVDEVEQPENLDGIPLQESLEAIPLQEIPGKRVKKLGFAPFG